MKSQGSTQGLPPKLTCLSVGEASGIAGVAVKCVDICRNIRGESARWTTTDAEERKLGEQTGLDTLVVLALNDQDLGCPAFVGRPVANALSPAPGEYGRKTETQRN